MFSIKATYRSETRKFSFSDPSFPTYNQIQEQLVRVFPISSSYYLARLLFTQSQNAPFARILIGMEARSEEEYEQHVRPFRGRNWPGGLLRFAVCDDETPRDAPGNVPANMSTQQDDEDTPMDDPHSVEGTRRRSRRHEHRHGHHRDRGHHHRSEVPEWVRPRSTFLAPPPPPLPPPPPPPPLVFPPFPFYVPPPPPPPPHLHGAPLTMPPHPIFSPHVMHPAPPLPSLPNIQPFSHSDLQQPPPPTLDSDETPVQRLFRHRGLRSVASAPVLGPPFPVPPPPPPPPRPVSLFEDESNIPDTALFTRSNSYKAQVSEEMDVFYEGEVQARTVGASNKGKQRDSCCDVERTKQEISSLIRTFKTDVDLVLSRSLGMDPTDVWGVTSTEGQSKPGTPPLSIEQERVTTSQSQLEEAAHSAEPQSPPSPVIHENIICDMCHDVVIGVRYKCLDCPDFDLCSSCLAIQPHSIGSHSKSHALFAIEEPGGVWVHTSFTGEGTTDPVNPTVTNEGLAELPITTSGSDVQEEHTAPVADGVVHDTACSLCDSSIIGDRFKCFDCPDFDTCASCYGIVPIHHPGHGFVRLHDPNDLKLPSPSKPIHPALCNGCGNVIHGIRYKCMHPACNDFDLCANCEAHPIPVHPTGHVMLKIRKPGAYIPAVKRHGESGAQTSPIASTSGSQGPQEDDAQEAANDHSRICISTNIGVALSPVDPDTAPTTIPLNMPLPEASPRPPAELVDVSLPDFEQNVYGESAKKPVSFAFGAPLLTRESVGPSQSGHYSPTAAPLLPVPSPPPALPTEFIRVVPSLPQNGQYTEELITGLHGSNAHSAPWWGQSAWVPPTPPAPLPVPLRTPSTPRRSRSPEPLVSLVEQGDAANVSANTLVATAIPRPESGSGQSHTSLPHVPPVDFNELFDLASQFRHLLELPPVVTPPALPAQPQDMPHGSGTDTAVEGSVPTELASTQVDDAGTPLSLVALLSKPEKTPRHGVLDAINPGRLLSQLLDSSTTSVSSPVDKNNSVAEDVPLRASFVADNNIPDGQIFPPGAEFVKSWRMRNDGPGPWPADTELVFVAGDKLMIDTSERFKVGGVPSGEEVDVWTGEMKAPDVPGKYISYWRLCDNKGRRFGHSIWIDVCVAEPSKAPTPDDGCASLASSSVVMPRSAPSAPTAPIPSHDESTTAPPLSDASSISLIDVPSDDSDDDSDVYEDSRSHFGPTPANGQILSPDVDYVVLSDGSSEL